MMENNIVSKIKCVLFELSNICNYYIDHIKCPLHNINSKQILPLNIFRKTLTELKELNYKGVIGFSVYNEPLIDPRLFLMVSEIKNMFGYDIEVFILSNGFYINQVLVNELENIGVGWLCLTAYSNEEAERMSKFTVNGNMKFNWFDVHFDNRLNIYDGFGKEDSTLQCGAPYSEVIIGCDGGVYLCCLDWNKENKLGDLYNQNLIDVLNSDECLNLNKDLGSGIRIKNICKHCWGQRGPILNIMNRWFE
jgi:radical SAM protein with 4Fe4S-binding SPASM domain